MGTFSPAAGAQHSHTVASALHAAPRCRDAASSLTPHATRYTRPPAFVFGVMHSLLVTVRDCPWLGGTKKGVFVARAVRKGAIVCMDRPFVSSMEPDEVKSALEETMEACMAPHRRQMPFVFDHLDESVDLHDLVPADQYDHVVNEVAVYSPELGQAVFKRIMATHMPLVEGAPPSLAARLLPLAVTRLPHPQAASACSRCSAS